MLIVNERWDRLKRQISPRTWDAIKHKAQWEAITLSAVVAEYPDYLPKRLRRLAASCFVRTNREYLEARRVELAKELRRVELALADAGDREGA